jgi:hypothetical protein
MADVGPFDHAIRDQKVPDDRIVAELAERQHGVVARRQLMTLGVGRGGIDRRVRAGRLHRVHAGVFAVGHRHLSRHGRWLAAVLACGSGAMLSHRSAAALWGMLVTSGSRIDVVTPTRTRHNREGIALHRVRSLHEEDCATTEGIPVTSVSRTLIDIAPVVLPRQLRRAVDEAERLEFFDLTAVDRLIQRSHGHRGLRSLRLVLRDFRGPPALTRSELERRFLALCSEAGLPRPQVNVLVAGYEVDVVWPAWRLVVELDGYAFHRDRTAFEEDRERDAVLQLAGYRVLRITHRRLDELPDRVIDAIWSLADRR